jgi:ATP-dependent Clp protease ATP-binding subunit ClpB
MDPSKFTQKVTEILNAAQELAQEHSHQQLTPIHVAVAMFEDKEGLAKAALAKQDGGAADALASVLRVLRRALVRLPAVSTGDAGGDVYISPDLKKVLQAAGKLQKVKGDSFLGEWPARSAHSGHF